MQNLHDKSANTCHQCGGQLASESAGRFCSRCLSHISLLDHVDLLETSEDLNGILPLSGLNTPTTVGIGDYELIDEIARGGIGVVWKARQKSLNRIVAIKMLLFGGMASPENIERFHRETLAAASLDHPHVVRVLDAGEHDGQPFLVMEYIDGPSLADRLRDGPMLGREAAVIVEKLTHAVQFAHEHGILHRDLKPSNILLGQSGEPRVTDFGLAKLAGNNPELTLTTQALGTPNYIPPEQTACTSKLESNIGPQSDIYGLGAILYHCLTGRPPFQAETLPELLVQVREKEPVRPTLLNPSVPKDLETICAKCLEKQPGKRYSSASALARDLARFLADEPILARPVSRPERAWRWCRRKPVIASLSAAILILLLAITIGAPIAAFRINRERNVASSERARAEENLYVADMNLAAQAWEAGNLSRARDLLKQHWPGSDFSSGDVTSSPNSPSFEWRLLWGLAHEDHSKFSINSGTNPISSVALSPGGTLLAWGAGTAVSIIDLAAGRELAILNGHPLGASSLAFSANGDWLASGSGDGRISLWNSGSWRESRVLMGHSKAVEFVAFHPNHRNLISIGETVRLWELGAGESMVRMPRPGRWNTISPDGILLASYGGLNNTVQFWKLGAQNEQLPQLPPQKGIILAISFFPDGKSAFISAHDSTVTRWDLASMKPIRTYRQKSMVSALAVSANGKTLATANHDRVIKLWEVESGQELRTLRGHTNDVKRLVLSADGQTLVSASENSIKVWDSRVERETNVLHHQTLVLNLSLSRNGKVLATSDPNSHTVSVWDVPSQRLRYHFTDPEKKRRATVALSPDGRWLAVGWFTHGVLELWDMTTEPFQRGPTNAFGFAFGSHLNFSADGSVLAFRGVNRRINLWDVNLQKIVGALDEHGSYCATAFTTDGRIIATSSAREIRLWDLRSQQLLATFNAPLGNVWSLSFSPNGRLLASGGYSQDVRVWDVHAPPQVRALPPLVGHTANARAVVFSPDGRTLVSGSFDSTIKLWSIPLWKQLATLREHSSEIQCLAFSPDGNTLFTGSGDATVRIWRAPKFNEIAAAEMRKRRQNETAR